MIDEAGLRFHISLYKITLQLITANHQGCVVEPTVNSLTFVSLLASSFAVASPIEVKTRYPIELEPSVDTKAALKEVEIEENDYAYGKKVHELGLPENVLITLINREGKFMVPREDDRNSGQ